MEVEETKVCNNVIGSVGRAGKGKMNFTAHKPFSESEIETGGFKAKYKWREIAELYGKHSIGRIPAGWQP